jgi:hypothetical protein
MAELCSGCAEHGVRELRRVRVAQRRGIVWRFEFQLDQPGCEFGTKLERVGDFNMELIALGGPTE